MEIQPKKILSKENNMELFALSLLQGSVRAEGEEINMVSVPHITQKRVDIRKFLHIIKLKGVKMGEFRNYLIMEKELQKKYSYKIVAIYKGKVVASGNTYKEVLDKAYKKVGKVKMMIHQVGSSEDSVSILYIDGIQI